MLTHVFGIINWANKYVQQTETHHTNSMLVQKSDITEDLPEINLEPKYDFDQKSFTKASTKICLVSTLREQNPYLSLPHHKHQEYDRSFHRIIRRFPPEVHSTSFHTSFTKPSTCWIFISNN